MEINEIKEVVFNSDEYNFIKTDENLGDKVIVLGLGGSYAYGMNNENSDIDIRGIAINTKRNLLIGRDFEQIVETNTDTTIYSVNKIFNLLCECNPNTIEILGLKPEHYIYKNKLFDMIYDNRELFLSQRAAKSFAGYSNSQLRRLENKSARLVSQQQMEQHILKSINVANNTFKEKYFYMPDDSIKLYIDKAVQEGFDTEIFMDVNLKHYPLRDFKDMWSEMHGIVKSYSKIGRRNSRAIEHDKLGKHMAHLVRLYYMCFDILENKEIITYRDKEHDLLMSIRNGEYLDGNRQPIPAFYDLVDELEKRWQYDIKNTDLPKIPDSESVNDLLFSIYEEAFKEVSE